LPHAQTALGARPKSPPTRRRAAAAAIAAAAVIPGAAHALGLGEVTQQSALGRPLRVVVPVIASPGEEISGECFRLVSTPRPGDGIPEVLTGRVSVERTGATARLVITSQRAFDDPVVRLTVQAGCESPVRREYTLLLDPLPIEAPVVAAEPPVRPPEPASAAAGFAVGAGASARVAAAAPPPAGRERRSSPRTAAPASARARAEAPPARAAPAPRPARIPASSPPVAPPKPKLTVSTAVPAPGAAAPVPNDAAALARQQQELADTLDAETIVLRQRVAELTATVERMQKEIEAAQALQAARLAAEEAAKRTPEATLARWWAEGWPIVAGAIGLALLIAALLAWRRRRPPEEYQEWMPAATAAEPPVPPRPAASQPGVRTASPAQPAPDVATAPPARAGPDTSSRPTAVAVSDLSHVTEEAGVYLAFNRVDQAIEVLEEHIRTVPDSPPAAWLMLFDLYRRQGRETQFRKLANEYPRRFNAPAPDWESHPATADAGGVEAFPRVVPQRSEIAHAEPFGAPGTPRPPTSPAQLAAAAATATRRPPTLDLELELDRDMLDAARPAPPSATSGRS
jgi:hypothetical protein